MNRVIVHAAREQVLRSLPTTCALGDFVLILLGRFFEKVFVSYHPHVFVCMKPYSVPTPNCGPRDKRLMAHGLNPKP
jgi:hypothetical protein